MRYAVTGTEKRMDYLRELLLADGHTRCPPEEAEVLVPPPWEEGAQYARQESYRVANAALTAEGALALLQQAAVLPGGRC